MKKICLFFACFTLTLCFFSIIVNKSADANTQITLQYALKQPLDNIIAGDMTKAFKEKLEEISDRSVLVQFKKVGNEDRYDSTFDMLVRGNVDIGIVNVATLAEYGLEKAKILTTPYLFENDVHFWNFTSSDIAQDLLLEPIDGLGLRGLCYGEEGFRNFFFRNKVDGFEDFKDQIIRVNRDSIEMEITKDLYASPTPLAWSELYTAFSSGTIDGADGTVEQYNSPYPTDSIITHIADAVIAKYGSLDTFYNKITGIVPYLILDGHTVEATEIIITEETWESLTGKQQAWIIEASQYASQVCREKLAETEAQALESLRKDGVTITEVSDKTPWRNACQNTINKYIAGQEVLYQQILDLQYQSAESRVSTAPSNSQTGTIYCLECGQQIAATSKFCMYCGYKIPSVSAPAAKTPQPTKTPAPAAKTPQPTKTPAPVTKTWSSWSSWSTSPAYSSSTREVETRTTVKGYNMFHYRTQYRDAPYPRVFRDYSINGDYDWKYSRRSYGEKYMEKYVTADQLAAATIYSPDSRNMYNGKHPGYQDGTTIAYGFKDDEFMWFIRSKDTVTEYRYRNLK